MKFPGHKDNPLIVFPRHARIMGGDESSIEVQYSNERGIYYVVSPKLGSPFTPARQEELNKIVATIARHWLNQLQNHYNKNK